MYRRGTAGAESAGTGLDLYCTKTQLYLILIWSYGENIFCFPPTRSSSSAWTLGDSQSFLIGSSVSNSLFRKHVNMQKQKELHLLYHQPILIPSSSDNDVRSQPFPSHPHTKVSPWWRGKAHKVVMNRQGNFPMIWTGDLAGPCASRPDAWSASLGAAESSERQPAPPKGCRM